jgi:ketosteroid isomerase-like protein
LEKNALEKWNNGDPSGYLALYAPDFTYFDPTLERRMNGYEAIEAYYNALTGQVQVEKSELINPVVQATESMAVLSFNLISEYGGKVYKWNCTEVYRKNMDNEWKIVHNHWSEYMPGIQEMV